MTLDSICLSIMKGKEEHKYPASTFVTNCKGKSYFIEQNL